MIKKVKRLELRDKSKSTSDPDVVSLNSKLSTLNTSSARGFTLLLAVLMSSILIALGSAIFNIVSKEIILSSSGRESQFAFYSADTGVECALYWDTKQDAFSTTSLLTTVNCGGVANLTRDLQNDNTPQETLITTFSFSLGAGLSAPCSSVRVARTYYPTHTTIESLGYNTCVTTSPLRLERAIRVQY